MDCNMAGFPVLHHFLEFTQTHIDSVMSSNHRILCQPLLLLPSIFLNISVFFSESVLCIRWPKYWSFSISPSNEYSGLISFRIDWFDLLAIQGTLKESYSAAHLTLWDHNLDNHLKLDSSPPQMYYWAAMPQYMQAYNILVNLFKIIHSLSCFSRIQLFAMLWTKACQASLSMVFSRQKYWSELPCPLPGNQTCFSYISCICRWDHYH